MYTRLLIYCLFAPLTAFFLLVSPVTRPFGLVDSAMAAPKKAKSADKKSAKDEAVGVGSQTLAVCEQDIYYSWRRVTRVTRAEKNSKDADNDNKTELFKPIEVLFTRVSEQGTKESAIKTKLLSMLSTHQASARNYCEREHNDKTRCVVSKLKSLEKDYRVLDYRVRKALLDSVTDDCSRNAGLCLSTRAGEVTCFTKAAEGSSASGKKEEESSKKGKKKKKKK